MIEVAIGIISQPRSQIFLMTQRGEGMSHAGCWEFPGGKIEPQELPEDALQRELFEELGIQVVEFIFLGHHEHEYPDACVRLWVYEIVEYSGEPHCLAGQTDLRWMSIEQLNKENVLGAVFDCIQLRTWFGKTW